MLGMAKRAGKVSSGEFICSKAIKRREAKLVILAEDASENTKKSIKNSCTYYNVKCIEYADMQLLGKFCGGGERAVAAVNDENFAKTIIEIYNSTNA